MAWLLRSQARRTNRPSYVLPVPIAHHFATNHSVHPEKNFFVDFGCTPVEKSIDLRPPAASSLRYDGPASPLRSELTLSVRSGSSTLMYRRLCCSQAPSRNLQAGKPAFFPTSLRSANEDTGASSGYLTNTPPKRTGGDSGLRLTSCQPTTGRTPKAVRLWPERHRPTRPTAPKKCRVKSWNPCKSHVFSPPLQDKSRFFLFFFHPHKSSSIIELCLNSPCTPPC